MCCDGFLMVYTYVSDLPKCTADCMWIIAPHYFNEIKIMEKKLSQTKILNTSYHVVLSALALSLEHHLANMI